MLGSPAAEKVLIRNGLEKLVLYIKKSVSGVCGVKLGRWRFSWHLV